MVETETRSHSGTGDPETELALLVVDDGLRHAREGARFDPIPARRSGRPTRIFAMNQATQNSGRTLTNRGRPWPFVLVVLLMVTVAASVALAADSLIVSQRNRTFSPNQLQVTRGSTVRIMNDDKATHHIYIDAPTMKFDSGEQSVGTAVELKFNEAGTFDVLCAIHPTMRLQVNVK